jgi:hypothetical protein
MMPRRCKLNNSNLKISNEKANHFVIKLIFNAKLFFIAVKYILTISEILLIISSIICFPLIRSSEVAKGEKEVLSTSL